jgi:hypothetical protein
VSRIRRRRFFVLGTLSTIQTWTTVPILYLFRSKRLSGLCRAMHGYKSMSDIPGLAASGEHVTVMERTAVLDIPASVNVSQSTKSLHLYLHDVILSVKSGVSGKS